MSLLEHLSFASPKFHLGTHDPQHYEAKFILQDRWVKKTKTK